MQPNQASTILRPPWLHLARFAWVIVSAAALAAFIAEVAVILPAPLQNCTDPAVICGPWHVGQEDIALGEALNVPGQLLVFVYLFNSVFPRIAFFLAGSAIFWQRSDDWVALMLSLMLTTFAVEGVQNLGNFMPVVHIIYAIATAAFVLLPFVFPNGRIVPGWMAWIVPPLLVATLFAILSPYLGIQINEQIYAILSLGVFFPWFLTGGYAAIYRYRRVSNAIERQQTKWVMAGILGTFILFIPFTIISIYFPPSNPTPERLAFVYLIYMPMGLLGYLFIPISIGIAILRYRLWDIDVIIRRTLVYFTLTILLALVYFGSITVLQSVFSVFSGQQSTAAIVLSTLGIAALFNPLRHRIQDAIDRRFYRRKYDSEQALGKFAAVARSEVDLARLNEALIQISHETLQPEKVSLSLTKRSHTLE